MSQVRVGKIRTSLKRTVKVDDYLERRTSKGFRRCIGEEGKIWKVMRVNQFNDRSETFGELWNWTQDNSSKCFPPGKGEGRLRTKTLNVIDISLLRRSFDSLLGFASCLSKEL